jgi:hypothetical protein
METCAVTFDRQLVQHISIERASERGRERERERRREENISKEMSTDGMKFSSGTLPIRSYATHIMRT